jgi:hypothetical protein
MLQQEQLLGKPAHKSGSVGAAFTGAKVVVCRRHGAHDGAWPIMQSRRLAPSCRWARATCCVQPEAAQPQLRNPYAGRQELLPLPQAQDSVLQVGRPDVPWQRCVHRRGGAARLVEFCSKT